MPRSTGPPFGNGSTRSSKSRERSFTAPLAHLPKFVVESSLAPSLGSQRKGVERNSGVASLTNCSRSSEAAAKQQSAAFSAQAARTGGSRQLHLVAARSRHPRLLQGWSASPVSSCVQPRLG